MLATSRREKVRSDKLVVLLPVDLALTIKREATELGVPTNHVFRDRMIESYKHRAPYVSEIASVG